MYNYMLYKVDTLLLFLYYKLLINPCGLYKFNYTLAYEYLSIILLLGAQSF